MTETICNNCGGTEFGPGFNGRMAPGNRPPTCLTCGSAERHRAIRAVYNRLAPMMKTWRVLHFAPERSVDRNWFQSYTPSMYGKLNSYDMQATGLPPGSFDLVIANHVLEHVANDGMAVRECLRILEPDGILSLCVPTPMHRWQTDDWGFADPVKNEHYRDYGTDFWLRLRACVPGVMGLFIAVTDPVTDVRDHLYLVSRGPAILEQVGAKLVGHNIPLLRLE